MRNILKFSSFLLIINATVCARVRRSESIRIDYIKNIFLSLVDVKKEKKCWVVENIYIKLRGALEKCLSVTFNVSISVQEIQK